MRYYLILLVFFLLGDVYSQKPDVSVNISSVTTYNKTPIENSQPIMCKVYRIKKIENAYIIDVDVRDKVKYFKYTIISPKSEKQKLKKIKKGKQYEFILFAYSPYILIGDPIYTYYTVEGVKVGFKGDFKTGQIVTTPNLQGLYYIKPK